MTPPRTPWRVAVDAVLADGCWHSLDELVEAAGPEVPPGRAGRVGERDRARQASGGRRRGGVDRGIEAGRRMIVRDVVAAMVRDGRVERRGGPFAGSIEYRVVVS